MWIRLFDKKRNKVFFVNPSNIAWCAFESEYNPDWQSDVLTCELSLSDGTAIISDDPQVSIVDLYEYVSGSRADEDEDELD